MSIDGNDVAQVKAIETELAEVFEGHGLRLTETTWKRNLEKHTLSLAVKVSGDLAVQGDLFEE